MNMKKIYLFAFIFLISFSLAQAKDFTFIDGLEDVPLMDNLKQSVDDTVSFGNEEARFVEVYLTSSKVGFKSVSKFYRETDRKSVV